MTTWCLQWPRAWGESLGQGIIRTQPEDFQVTEDLGFELDGDGEHLCLYLEKRGENTEYLAGELGRLAGCPAWQIGYCGLKDRHAVTRQWFSLTLAQAREADFMAEVASRWTVLAVSRHRQKLRRGQHAFNHFRIRVRGLVADPLALDARLQRLRDSGCPNYYGEQRFGFKGSNLARACNLRAHHLRRKQPRDGMALSAMRSWLFNNYLAERVVAGSWRERLEGDPGDLAGHASGPLLGDSGSLAREPQKSDEQRQLADWPDFAALLYAARVRPERRALVLQPQNMLWSLSDDELELSLSLPPGTFLTSVLSELIDFSSEPVSLQEPIAMDAPLSSP